jgi:hypothetical protein
MVHDFEHRLDSEFAVTATEFADRAQVLTVPGPILDRVDELVALSRLCPLRLDFAEGKCRIHFTTDGALSDSAICSVDLPWRHGIFRTALARIAALCNERIPDSVSPYGGTGELTVPGDPPTVSRVAFSNKSGDCWLDIRPVPGERILTAPVAAPVVNELLHRSAPAN